MPEVCTLRGIAALEIGVVVPDGMMTYPGKSEVRVVWGEEMAVGAIASFLREHEMCVKTKGPKDRGFARACVVT